MTDLHVEAVFSKFMFICLLVVFSFSSRWIDSDVCVCVCVCACMMEVGGFKSKAKDSQRKLLVGCSLSRRYPAIYYER